MDTNVISQFAPGKNGEQKPVPELTAWVRKQTDRLFLSTVSVVEIVAGIEKLRRAGAERRAADLDEWFDRIIDMYGERILPLTIEVGRIAGSLADHARAIGRQPGLADVLIAATAQTHRLGLLTTNTRHFEPLGLKGVVANPLEQLPDTDAIV